MAKKIIGNPKSEMNGLKTVHDPKGLIALSPEEITEANRKQIVLENALAGVSEKTAKKAPKEKAVKTSEPKALSATLNKYGFIHISKALLKALGWAEGTEIELTVAVGDSEVTFSRKANA